MKLRLAVRTSLYFFPLRDATLTMYKYGCRERKVRRDARTRFSAARVPEPNRSVHAIIAAQPIWSRGVDLHSLTGRPEEYWMFAI